MKGSSVFHHIFYDTFSGQFSCLIVLLNVYKLWRNEEKMGLVYKITYFKTMFSFRQVCCHLFHLFLKRFLFVVVVRHVAWLRIVFLPHCCTRN